MTFAFHSAGRRLVVLVLLVGFLTTLFHGSLSAVADSPRQPPTIEGVKYLLTLGCDRCYSGVESATLEALSSDNEKLRYETAEAISRLQRAPCPKCNAPRFSESIRVKLAALAYERHPDHAEKWLEPSPRVREMAKQVVTDWQNAKLKTDGESPATLDAIMRRADQPFSLTKGEKDDLEMRRSFAVAVFANQQESDAAAFARATKLRDAARKIDAIAADLDAANFDEEADALFEQSRAMRAAARRTRPIVWPDSTERVNALSSMQYSLHTLRVQIALYRNQHDGRFPEFALDSNGKGSLPQLTAATNLEGKIGAGRDFAFGPYIASAIPPNPLVDGDEMSVVVKVDKWPPEKVEKHGGWLYHSTSGQIAPNSPGHLQD